MMMLKVRRAVLAHGSDLSPAAREKDRFSNCSRITLPDDRVPLYFTISERERTTRGEERFTRIYHRLISQNASTSSFHEACVDRF